MPNTLSLWLHLSALLEAFQTLGYGTIYNSRETLRRHQETFCNAGLDAKYTNSGPKFELEQFESLFGEYRVISGEFVCAYASELIDAYPNAKVILSIRNDEEKWLRSLMETMWYNNTIWATKFLQWTDPTTRGRFTQSNLVAKRRYMLTSLLWYAPSQRNGGSTCSGTTSQATGSEFTASTTLW